jgi:bacteriorhodopsin
MQQQHLHDWRTFLVSKGATKEAKSPAPLGDAYPMQPWPAAMAVAPLPLPDEAPGELFAPQPSQVPVPMLKKKPISEELGFGVAGGQLSCLAGDPGQNWVMSQPDARTCERDVSGFSPCVDKGGPVANMNLKQLLVASDNFEPSPSDFDTTASDQEDLQANVDDGSVEDNRDKKAARRPSWRSNGSDTVETLSHMVENRRHKIISEEETHHHSKLHKIAHKCEWFGCIAFTLASLVMFGNWARHINEEVFVSTFFVTAIAASAYLTKATIGDFIIGGTRVPVARYLDWVTTTPLMLYEICHLGHAPFHTTMMVVGCDILMLSFGIVSALISWERHKGLKHVWFIMSSIFYILMVVTLHVDVGHGSAMGQPDQVQNLFAQLEWLTVITWSFFPFVVVLGRAHFKVISRDVEDILLMILDVTAKIGMEGFIVASCSGGGCSGTDGSSDGKGDYAH